MRRLALLVIALSALVGSGGFRSAGAGAAPVNAHGSSTEFSGIAYTDDGGQLLGMDVYEPNQHPAPAPVVLVVHGGGWAGGDRSDVRPEAEALAAAGFVAVAPDYRLSAPGSPAFPSALDDLEAALAWIQQHAVAFDADPGRVAALGVSAGGNLALDLGVRNRVAAVVSWSGPTDLAAFETTSQRCTRPACGPLSLPYAVYQYLGCLPERCPGTYRAASPVMGVAGSRAAFMIWNSSSELVPRPQADEFAGAAVRAHVRVAERVLAGDLHAAEYSGQALGPSVAFLRSLLG